MKKLLVMLLISLLSLPGLVLGAEKKDPLAAWKPNTTIPDAF